MSLTNPNANTKFFGFTMSNMVLYGIILLVVFIVVKVGVIFSNLWKKIKKMFGFSDDDDKDDNQDEIKKSLENDPAVQSQLTIGSRQIADKIYNAVNGFGIDDDLYQIFKSISGPNQMKAIFLAYGQRTVTIVPFYSFTGNLSAMLKWRLTETQFNKNIGTQQTKYSIRTLLNWIK